MKQVIRHIDKAIDSMKSQLAKLTHQQSVSQTGQEGKEQPAESAEGDKEKTEAVKKLESKIEETQSLIGEQKAAINDLTNLVKKQARPVDSLSNPQADNPSSSSLGLPPTTNLNPVAENPSKKLKTSNQTSDI
ncbi:hypothetical protein PSHT_06816 [Puccinia striiformis]|uniref:Uncharacterized protein n=1 Tax=Puccinia striiformis TaxID=27350 RepID=A0A2S4W374_9BASI|nr:hypothetical protein PSHT_06816 [Puccinia striiformis]